MVWLTTEVLMYYMSIESFHMIGFTGAEWNSISLESVWKGSKLGELNDQEYRGVGVRESK